jgi:hypothetical protein
MAQDHRFKSEWPSEALSARLDRIRVDLAGFAKPSRNGRYLRTPAVPGGGFERPNIAVGPDPNALIRIRGRPAAHAEALAPTTRWCVCPHLHYQSLLRPRTPRLDGHDDES